MENMALFTVYNLAGRKFFPQVRVEQDGIQDLHPLQAAVCGTLATSCVAPVITPIEYVKIQMQRKVGGTCTGMTHQNISLSHIQVKIQLVFFYCSGDQLPKFLECCLSLL